MINISIDSVDIFATYGAFVEQNGFADMLSLPSFKQLDITDWSDEDGIEVDLNNPVLDARSFQLTFCFIDANRLESFYNFIMGSQSHTIAASDLGVSMTVRCLTAGSLSIKVKKTGRLTLSFVEDIVTLTQTSRPATTKVWQTGYQLGGVNLSAYDIWVCEGSDESLRKPAAMKENIIINSRYVAGQTYKGYSHVATGSNDVVNDVHIKSKDVVLKLFIGDTTANLVAGLNSLYYDLTRPGLRTFSSPYSQNPSNCYYKSSSITKLEVFERSSGKKAWCEFTLTLCFVDGK